VTRTIRHLVLWARWEGTSIHPGATLPVGIAYVIDDSLLESKSFEVFQAEYVAIGLAKVSWTSSLWSRLWTRLRKRAPAQQPTTGDIERLRERSALVA
jgi:hypothetical protein